MALQTLTTSSTSDSSPSPTASSSGNGENASFASPVASPPLILAFLAIGLFTAAMVVVFGFRRIRFGRWGFQIVPLPVEDNLAITEAGSQPKRLGERPKLWDLWSAKTVDPSDATWDHITPISVMIIPEEKVKASNDTNASRMAPTANHNFLPFLGVMTKLPIPISHRVPRRYDPAHESKEKEVSHEKMKVGLQVAVAIVMPSRLRREVDITDLGAQAEKHEKVEYCMGVYRCPWQNTEM